MTEFLKEFLAATRRLWSRLFFGASAQPNQPVLEAARFDDVALVSKRKHTPRAKTLKELLANVEGAFEAVGLPSDWEWSHTVKDTVIALRKLGPHWSGNYRLEKLPPADEIRVPTGKWNGLMFCAYERMGIADAEWMVPAFSYASKLKKAPWFVEQRTGGFIYECGAAWRDLKTNKLVWGNWYVSIQKESGAIKLLTVLKIIPHTVGRKSRGRYSQKSWGKTPMAESAFNVPIDRREDVLREIVVRCFTDWNLLDTQWKVSVSKNGQRVTWTVPFAETKNYFADREATILDKNGKKKKIIHFVHQHDRILADGKASIVREHIRGISHFDWRGYTVDVIAPQFHLSAHDCDIGGYDEDEFYDKTGFIFLSKAGKQLADIESQHLRRPLGKVH